MSDGPHLPSASALLATSPCRLGAGHDAVQVTGGRSGGLVACLVPRLVPWVVSVLSGLPLGDLSLTRVSPRFGNWGDVDIVADLS